VFLAILGTFADRATYADAVRGYARRGRWPDAGELVSIILLALIAIWGLWFGVQSMLTLWWPLNVAYMVAGLVVAGVSAAVARAIVRR
jgi:fatty acid desaturase